MFSGYVANDIIPEGSSLAGIDIVADNGCDKRPSPTILVNVTVYISLNSGMPSSTASSENDASSCPYKRDTV